jgi:hypothetical protein
MRSRFVKTSSHFLQDVPDVDHEGVRNRFDVYPLVFYIFHLQPLITDHKYRQKTVVRMLSYCPKIWVCVLLKRIVKDPQESEMFLANGAYEEESVELE